jgi:hypothetical protein
VAFLVHPELRLAVAKQQRWTKCALLLAGSLVGFAALTAAKSLEQPSTSSDSLTAKKFVLTDNKGKPAQPGVPLHVRVLY